MRSQAEADSSFRNLDSSRAVQTRVRESVIPQIS
jgi:hypothetical protein